MNSPEKVKVHYMSVLPPFEFEYLGEYGAATKLKDIGLGSDELNFVMTVTDTESAIRRAKMTGYWARTNAADLAQLKEINEQFPDRNYVESTSDIGELPKVGDDIYLAYDVTGPHQSRITATGEIFHPPPDLSARTPGVRSDFEARMVAFGKGGGRKSKKRKSKKRKSKKRKDKKRKSKKRRTRRR